MNTELFAALPSGAGVLCAVSGGADSVYLLHRLKAQEEALGIRVCAGHFEHGLRGEESLRDCAFVERLCQTLGVPLRVGHGDVAAWAREHGLGLEEAARELRYAFLEQAADALGCAYIATAHTADDNAETILFHLLRGSGARGLQGIPPVRGRILRPLLDTSRAEVEAYLSGHGLPHVEDSSNADLSFARNRLRLRVMPELRALNPSFDEAAGRLAALLREDDEALCQMAADFIRDQFRDGSLPLAELTALPRAVSSRALRALCPRPLEQKHVEAALAFCRGSGFALLDLPGLRLRREQGRLYFSAAQRRPLPTRVIRPGTVVELPEAGLRLRASAGVYDGAEVYKPFKNLLLNCEMIQGDLVCSSRQAGDALRPQGRGLTKSLKALFLEAGLTQAERDSTPVFRDGTGVVAVYGLAVDERCAPAAGDRIWRLDFETL